MNNHISTGPFRVGDRVRVVGTPHMPGHSTGTIAEIQPYAYGIVFDGTGMVHRWYAASELARVGSVMPAGQASMAGMDSDVFSVRGIVGLGVTVAAMYFSMYYGMRNAMRSMERDRLSTRRSGRSGRTT